MKKSLVIVSSILLLTLIVSGCSSVDKDKVSPQTAAYMAKESKYKLDELCKAIEKDDLEVVKTSIASGTDLNFAYRSGDSTLIGKGTPLMFAAFWDRPQIARFLIESGAHLEDRSIDERTALTYAAMNGALKSVQVLIDKGADINVTDREGKSPLFYAKKHDYKDIINYLLEHGAKDVDVVDVDDKKSNTTINIDEMIASFNKVESNNNWSGLYAGIKGNSLDNVKIYVTDQWSYVSKDVKLGYIKHASELWFGMAGARGEKMNGRHVRIEFVHDLSERTVATWDDTWGPSLKN